MPVVKIKSGQKMPKNELKAKKIEAEQHEIRLRKKEGLSHKDKQDQKVEPVIKESSKVVSKTIQSKGQNTSIGYPFLIIVVLGVLMVIATLNLQNFSEASHNYNTVDTFTEKLNIMKEDFKSQHKVYWNLLKNSGTKHLMRIHKNDQSEMTPQSYLIAGYVGSEDTLKCFVKRLVHVFAKSDVSHINLERYSNTDKAILREQLVSKIEDISKIVVFENIEKLQFGATQLFIRYPQSLLLLTTVLPFAASQNRNADEHKTADYFKEVWKNVNVDLTSLWSKLGNGLILVQKEDDLLC